MYKLLFDEILVLVLYFNVGSLIELFKFTSKLLNVITWDQC